MIMIIILGFLALCFSVAHCQDYCKVTCGGKVHTMCTYKDDFPGPLCVNFDPDSRLTHQEKDAVLDLHNELRTRIAQGEAPPFPKALDVGDLLWSEENEIIARRWALQCDFKVSAYDKCINLLDGTYVEQNIYQSWNPGGFFFEVNLLEAVQSWFDQYKICKPKDANNTFPPTKLEGQEEKPTSHFTTMVWATTTHVGCERVWNNDEETLVCNYSPGGNRPDKPIYKVSAEEATAEEVSAGPEVSAKKVSVGPEASAKEASAKEATAKEDLAKEASAKEDLAVRHVGCVIMLSACLLGLALQANFSKGTL